MSVTEVLSMVMAKEEIRACLLLHPSSPQFGGSRSGGVPSRVARSRPGDRTRSCAGGSSSQPSPPACGCQHSVSPQPWDTLAGSLALQQEILPQRLQGGCEAGPQQDCGSYPVPSCLPISCSPGLSKASWKESPWSPVGNLMDPFRSGKELGSPTRPALPARCDAETSPGILPALSRAPTAPCFGSLLSHHAAVSFSLPKLL